jgi:STE24 endopeptidase
MFKSPRALVLAAVAVLLSATALADPAVVVPASSADALAVMRSGNILWAVGQLLALAIPFGFLVSGLGSRLRATCGRIARGRWFWTLVLFAGAYLGISALITLPLDFYGGFVRAHAHGWSHQTLPQWLVGEGVQLLVRLIAASAFLWIPYLLIKRSPRSWWLYGAVALVPVTFFVLVGLPVWVSPLTTHYKPLDDTQLGSKIHNLAARCGVSSIPVFVGGDDTTVVGLGPTNRIVLQSDLATVETPDQIEFTIGHELKHYVMDDNWKALAIIVALLLTGFLLADRLGQAAIRRFSLRFGFSDLSDAASLPLIALIFTGYWLCVVPLFNAYARHIEHEADRFGLELTHQNHADASIFAHEVQMGAPAEWDGFFLFFRATHPSRGDRIRFANSYAPWEQGLASVYAAECTSASPSPQ